VKIYIGAPGSEGAADQGYVPISKLRSIATRMRHSYLSFGGVALWDASSAYVNGRYDLGIKNGLKSAGGVGFRYPACSAPAYVSGQQYTGGEHVSCDGYIWQAKWWTESTPNHDPVGEWNEISACQGVPPPGQEPTRVPTVIAASPATVVPGMPTGALSNGAKGMYERVYFGNMQSVLLRWRWRRSGHR